MYNIGHTLCTEFSIIILCNHINFLTMLLKMFLCIPNFY